MRISLMIFLFGLLAFTNTSIAQKENPVGTIWLRDNIYIDKTPLLNIHYREYEHVMRTFYKFNLDTLLQIASSAPYFGFSPGKFIDSVKATPNPDSSRYKINQKAPVSWNNWVDFNTYLNDPVYNYYPLVNISYDNGERLWFN